MLAERERNQRWRLSRRSSLAAAGHPALTTTAAEWRAATQFETLASGGGAIHPRRNPRVFPNSALRVGRSVVDAHLACLAANDHWRRQRHGLLAPARAEAERLDSFACSALLSPRSRISEIKVLAGYRRGCLRSGIFLTGLFEFGYLLRCLGVARRTS